MAALVAVMIMVSVGTFDWDSVSPSHSQGHASSRNGRHGDHSRHRGHYHNLAYGVGAGVLLSAVFFVRHVSHVVRVTSVVDPDNVERLYAVSGELFFASTTISCTRSTTTP